MEMAAYLVTAVVVEGRSVRKVAKDHGVSKTWLYELVARYWAEGEAGLEPRSRRPHRSPAKVADRFENEIVRLRKELTEEGFDAGPETIRMHLRHAHPRAKVPSVSTIWRVLKARGFVVPEPHKRPKSSYVRFAATLPNECWQMDVTHVLLANGREVEILNVIDDHSRLCVSSVALRVFKAIDVVSTFYKAAGTWGLPAAVLSDNGAIFTAASRHGVCVMESELLSLGIEFKHSREPEADRHDHPDLPLARDSARQLRGAARRPRARTAAGRVLRVALNPTPGPVSAAGPQTSTSRGWSSHYPPPPQNRTGVSLLRSWMRWPATTPRSPPWGLGREQSASTLRSRIKVRWATVMK